MTYAGYIENIDQRLFCNVEHKMFAQFFIDFFRAYSSVTLAIMGIFLKQWAGVGAFPYMLVSLLTDVRLRLDTLLFSFCLKMLTNLAER